MKLLPFAADVILQLTNPKDSLRAGSLKSAVKLKLQQHTQQERFCTLTINQQRKKITLPGTKVRLGIRDTGHKFRIWERLLSTNSTKSISKPSNILHGVQKGNPNVFIELEKTLNVQSKLSKKKASCVNHTIQFQNRLQSSNNKTVSDWDKGKGHMGQRDRMESPE